MTFLFFILLISGDRARVYKTLHYVRVACTSEITLRTLLYVNCINVLSARRRGLV